MRNTSALGVLLAVATSGAAAAQDLPTFPPDPATREDDRLLLSDRPNVGYGPFHYVSLSLFPSLRSGFEARFPSSLPAGAFELRMTESWVQNFADTDRWVLDFELERSNIAFIWGMDEDWHLELDIETGVRTGGGLDAFILGFHHAFGLSPGGRNQFARMDNRIEIQPPGGGPRIVLDRNDPQPYEQAALITLERALTYGDDSIPAAAVALTIRRELEAGDLRGGGPVDLGGSIAFAKDLDPLHLYCGGTIEWFGQEEFFGLKLRTIQWTALFGVEWSVHPSLSLIGQFLATSGGVDRLGSLSRPSYEVTAGVKWQAWTGALIELAIVENVIFFDNGPDFGVHAGISIRW